MLPHRRGKAASVKHPLYAELQKMYTNNLSERIIDTVYSPELSDLGKECAETGLDQLLDEGFLIDLPLIGSIVKIFKGAMDIRDRIFIR